MLFKKFVVAIAASIIFSLILSLIDYTPLAERDENVLYNSFPSLLAMGTLYITPFFLILGIPLSMVWDIFLSKGKTRNRTRNYLLSVFYYAMSGVVVSLLLLLVFQGGRVSSLLAFFEVLCSVISASLLFLHLSILLDVLLKKMKGYLLNN
jgi:hypothetical protein